VATRHSAQSWVPCAGRANPSESVTSRRDSQADAVIDFSSPQGTSALAKRAESLGVALVIGTTAKDFEWRAEVKKSSEKVRPRPGSAEPV
jgi:dihydrodipicolinate reductase